MGFFCKLGLTKKFQQIANPGIGSGLDKHSWTLVINFIKVFSISSGPGRRNSISQPAKSPVRYASLLEMKTLLTIFGFFILFSCKDSDKKQTNTIKIEVVNCLTSMAYSFDGDSVVIKQVPYIYWGTKVDTNDLKKYTAIATKILEIKEDEVFDNVCVSDGFQIKVRTTYNGKSKILFVGNYYDSRVDSVISIFDKYINRENEFLKYNAFRYPKSMDRIKEMITDQEACPITLSDERKKDILRSQQR